VDPRDADLVSSLLFDAGAGGIEEQNEPEATVLVLYAEAAAELERIQDGLLELLQALPELERPPSFELCALDADFGRAWVDYLKPEWLTSTLVIQPASSPDPGPGVRVLRYHPELAFGTGSHPTTLLAARAVAEFVGAHPGVELLDVGSGNGVLAMVGLVCGASDALGLDIDPVAVRSASANAELNGLGARCRFDILPLEKLERGFALVVANIDAPTLQQLASALCACTRGTLLVTGLLSERSAEVQASFEAVGLRLTGRQELEDWCLLRFEPTLTKPDQL
jgi:ribosomal protein L11 methyltransferase